MDTKRVILLLGGVALAISLVIAGTVALLLTRGDRIGRRVAVVGDRIARMGGGDVLPTLALVQAVCRHEVVEAMAAEAERPVTVVRRK